jgi:hypothetical protein
MSAMALLSEIRGIRPITAALDSTAWLRWLALGGILTAAAAFRVPNLATVPPPLADEILASVDIHYLVQTGHHFDGSKAGLLAHLIPIIDGRYLAALSIGDQIVSLRLLAAVFGIATVLLLVPLGSELGNTKLGYLAATSLTIMPWHVYYSRIFFPASEYLFLTVLAVVLALTALRKHSVPLAIGALAAGAMSIYIYPVALITTPMVLASIALYRRRTLGQFSTKAILAIALAIAALAAPYAIEHLVPTDPQVRLANTVASSKMIWGHGLGIGPGLLQFLRTWTGYITPQFILLQGDPNVSQSIQLMGEAGWVAGFLGLVGITTAAIRRTATHQLLLAWLLLYPVSDALTFYDASGNSLRALSGCVVWALLSGVGFLELSRLARGPKSLGLVEGTTFGVLVLQSLAFASLYFGAYGRIYDYSFETGYDRVIRSLQQHGLLSVPITVHAGYERDAVLQYFSHYRLHPTQTVLACYDLPYDVVHFTVPPRIFVIREDPGFSKEPGCVHSDLVGRDLLALNHPLNRPEEATRRLEVIDEFANDSAGRYRTAIVFLHQ